MVHEPIMYVAVLVIFPGKHRVIGVVVQIKHHSAPGKRHAIGIQITAGCIDMQGVTTRYLVSNCPFALE